MASPLSGVGNSLFKLAEIKRQKQQSQYDDLIKQAQLKELGYDITPGHGGGYALAQRPDYLSMKDLEKKKLQGELEVQESLKNQVFGKGQSFGGGAGSPMLKSFKIGGQDFANPEYDEYERQNKLKEDLQKPLTGDTANKYSGAKQGIGNIQQIMDSLGLEKNESSGKVIASPKFGDISNKFKRYSVASKMGGAGMTVPNIITGGLYGKILGADVSPEIKNLATSYKLLIENQLRARSGAAVPETEVQREFDRTAMDFFADPESVYNKLNEANKYLAGTADEIRPGQTPKLNTGKRFGMINQKNGNSGNDISSLSDDELRKMAGL